MRLRIGLIIVLLGILFPVAWLGRFSAAYARSFDAIFAPEWTHLVAHSFMFAALAVLVIMLFRLPFSARAILLIVGTVLGVGAMQEIIQALTGGEGGLSGALFDLGVDLCGAGLGALSVWCFYPPGSKKR